MDYEKKYLKYKEKYLKLQKQMGGVEERLDDENFKLSNIHGTCWYVSVIIIMLLGDKTRDDITEKVRNISSLELFEQGKELFKKVFGSVINVETKKSFILEILENIRNKIAIFYRINNPLQNTYITTSADIELELIQCERTFINVYKNLFPEEWEFKNYKGGTYIDIYIMLNIISIFYLNKLVNIENEYLTLLKTINYDNENIIGAIVNSDNHSMCFYKYFGCEKFSNNSNIFNFNWSELFKTYNYNLDKKPFIQYDMNVEGPLKLNYEEIRGGISKYKEIKISESTCTNGKKPNVNLNPNNYHYSSILDISFLYLDKSSTVNEFIDKNMIYLINLKYYDLDDNFTEFIKLNSLHNKIIDNFYEKNTRLAFIFASNSRGTHNRIWEPFCYKSLLSLDVDLTVKNTEQQTPIMVIIMNERHDILELVIKYIDENKKYDILSIVDSENKNVIDYIKKYISKYMEYYLSLILKFDFKITPNNLFETYNDNNNIDFIKLLKYNLELFKENDKSIFNFIFEKMFMSDMVELFDYISENHNDIFSIIYSNNFFIHNLFTNTQNYNKILYFVKKNSDILFLTNDRKITLFENLINYDSLKKYLLDEYLLMLDFDKISYIKIYTILDILIRNNNNEYISIIFDKLIVYKNYYDKIVNETDIIKIMFVHMSANDLIIILNKFNFEIKQEYIFEYINNNYYRIDFTKINKIFEYLYCKNKSYEINDDIIKIICEKSPYDFLIMSKKYNFKAKQLYFDILLNQKKNVDLKMLINYIKINDELNNNFNNNKLTEYLIEKMNIKYLEIYELVNLLNENNFEIWPKYFFDYIKNKEEKNKIYEASILKSINILEPLNKFDVNMLDDEGNTLLMYEIKKMIKVDSINETSLLEKILSLNPNINIKNKNNESVCNIIKNNKNRKIIVEIFKKYNLEFVEDINAKLLYELISVDNNHDIKKINELLCQDINLSYLHDNDDKNNTLLTKIILQADKIPSLENILNYAISITTDLDLLTTNSNKENILFAAIITKNSIFNAVLTRINSVKNIEIIKQIINTTNIKLNYPLWIGITKRKFDNVLNLLDNRIKPKYDLVRDKDVFIYAMILLKPGQIQEENIKQKIVKIINKLFNDRTFISYLNKLENPGGQEYSNKSSFEIAYMYRQYNFSYEILKKIKQIFPNSYKNSFKEYKDFVKKITPDIKTDGQKKIIELLDE